jgi:putative Holliday junction resolvase
MRVLAVDHGEKRIGLAISDPTGTLARPLAVFEHVSQELDAGNVLLQAAQNHAALIVIGQSFDEEGAANRAGRRAATFAQAIRSQSEIPVVLWDESLSSQDAKAARIAAGAPRKRRRQAVDALAAAMILQSYLDANHEPGPGIVEA